MNEHLHLCQPCRIKQGYMRKDKGCHTAILSYCKSCGESSGILTNNHWVKGGNMEAGKKMRAPTKEQVYHDKNTWKHKCEALEHELKQFQWVDVNERLPEAREKIIAQTKRHGVKLGISMGYKKATIWTSHSEHQFTHWMPLPKFNN